MPLFETPASPSEDTTETTTHVSPEQPHVAPQGTVQKVRAGRYGEMEAHELVHLLDTIDTERERARFRESLYLSFFVWIAVAWFIFYGPRVLWHSPQLRNPADVLRERELTNLTLPNLRPPATSPQPSAKPAPRPSIDSKTMENLRANAAKPAPTPLPSTPQPQPQPTSAPPPPQPTPRPSNTPVPDAPTQPSKPNFNTSSNAGDAIRSAVNGAAHDRGGSLGGSRGAARGPVNLGGVQVLSDTQGVDFNPYLRRILADIRRNWEPLLPEETFPPLSKQGETYIRFSILPDGNIGAIHLDDSTHDVAIDKSCWGSIISEGQFPPLPAQFHGPNLELRIHYLVNKGLGE
jgi:outer membrane biosynthesis protein TonB